MTDQQKIDLLRAALFEYTGRHEQECDPVGLPEYDQAIAALEATQ